MWSYDCLGAAHRAVAMCGHAVMPTAFAYARTARAVVRAPRGDKAWAKLGLKPSKAWSIYWGQMNPVMSNDWIN